MLLRLQRQQRLLLALINGTVVSRRTEGSVALTEGSSAGIFVVGGAFTGAGDTVMSAGAG